MRGILYKKIDSKYDAKTTISDNNGTEIIGLNDRELIPKKISNELRTITCIKYTPKLHLENR